MLTRQKFKIMKRDNLCNLNRFCVVLYTNNIERKKSDVFNFQQNILSFKKYSYNTNQDLPEVAQSTSNE